MSLVVSNQSIWVVYFYSLNVAIQKREVVKNTAQVRRDGTK